MRSWFILSGRYAPDMSSLVPRSIGPLVLRSAATFPAVGIVGPRQSGKSSLARSLFPGHRLAVMESPDVLRAAMQDPRGFLDSFESGDGAVLDEIQRAPEILSYLLEYIDRDLRAGRRMGRWILTGSESLMLSQRITQSLAGRIAMHEVLPMDALELAEFPARRGDPRHSLTRAVVQGGYPALRAERPDRSTWFDAYVTTYIERDVRNILRVGDLSNFQRFLALCAGRTGQLLNLAQLGADAGIAQSTARAWMSVLEATYIVRLIPGWYGNISKRLVKAPKLHFVDTGLACALLGITDEKMLETHPLRGALVESWVAGELLKAQAVRGRGCLLSIPMLHGPELLGVLNFERREKAELVEYALNAGLTQDEVRTLADARAVALLYKAMRYDKAMAKRAQASESAKPPASSPTLKPGTTAAKPGVKVEVKKQFDRLKKTGSIDDAAKLFERML